MPFSSGTFPFSSSQFLRFVFRQKLNNYLYVAKSFNPSFNP